MPSSNMPIAFSLALGLAWPIFSIADSFVSLILPQSSDISDVPLGYGLDSVSGNPRGICISIPSSPSNPARSPSVQYSTTFIENSSDLYRFMGVDVKAAANFNTFSGSNKVRWLRQNALSTYSVYLAAKVSVRNQEQSFDRSRANLLPAITKLLSADTDEVWDTFHTKCGDLFSHTETRGGELFLIYELHTNSEKEKESLVTEIKASGFQGTWSASGRFTQVMERVERLSSIDVKIYFEGERPGAIRKIPNDANEALALATTFHSLVSDNDSATKYSQDFIGYETLPDVPPRNPVKRNHRRRVLDSLAETDLIAMATLANSRYIAGHPSEFESVQYPQLEKWEREILTIQEDISRYAVDCYNSSDQCKDRVRTDVLQIAQALPKQKSLPTSLIGCVASNNRFVSDRSGCLDKNTNIVWSRVSLSNLNFNEAQRYCAQWQQNGVFGWVLPSTLELKTLAGDFSSIAASDGVDWYWALGAKRVSLQSGSEKSMNPNYAIQAVCKRAFSTMVLPLKPEPLQKEITK